MRVTNNVNNKSFCARNVVINFTDGTYAVSEKVTMLVNKYKKVLNIDAPITPFVRLGPTRYLVLDADTLVGKIFLKLKEHFANLTFDDATGSTLEAETAKLIAGDGSTLGVNYDEFISFYSKGKK